MAMNLLAHLKNPLDDATTGEFLAGDLSHPRLPLAEVA